MSKNSRNEFSYYEAPDGEQYNLDDWDESIVMGESGGGMSPIEYRTTRGPFQHGETPLDYTLRPRVIQYTHRVSAHGRNNYWEARARILNKVRPNRQSLNSFSTGKLVKMLSNGNQRALNVLVESGPEFPKSGQDWDEWGSTGTLRFIAHDPIYYDPTLATKTFSGVISSELVFPITFPITFGSTVLYATDNIYYPGTWRAYPVIIVTGPLGGLILTNNATGKFIELAYNIPTGRVVTIDLAYGRKSITDDLGVNLLGVVTPESDLADWFIAPDPEAAGGVNEIQVEGSGIDGSQTSVVVQYYVRYIGI